MTTRVVDVPGKGRARVTDLGNGVARREYIDSVCGFRPGSAPSIAGSRSATAEARPLPSLYPELEPSYSATLGYEAEQTIRRDVAWTRRNLGDVESGGSLFAAERNPDCIIRATVPDDAPTPVQRGWLAFLDAPLTASEGGTRSYVNLLDLIAIRVARELAQFADWGES